MALPIFLGAGAGVGALVGAAAGYAVHRQKQGKPKPPTAKLEPEPKDSKAPAAPTSSSKSSTTKSARELFGAKVKYLTTSSEFYTMLVRFENYLQFKTERASFVTAVEHVDNLLGMDALLNGHKPIAKAALPNLAEVARRKVLAALNDIIAYSDQERPSPTKKESMTSIKDEINEALLSIVKDMNRALAAQPIKI